MAGTGQVADAGVKSRRGRRLAAVLLLLVLPLSLRLLAIDHGGERGYLPDTHAVRAALAMARDRELVPPAGQHSVYPNLLPYLLLPVYALELLLGLALDWWDSVQAFGEHLLEHPQHAAWPARALVALLGSATVWVVFRAARAAGLGAGSWVAAWLVATGLLHVQFSTQERPWVPMTAFLAAAVWAAVVHAREGGVRPLLLCGALAGLAAATHQGGLGGLAIPFFAWLSAPRAWRGADLARRALTGLGAVAAFSLVALVLGYPARMLHGATDAQLVVGGAQAAAQGAIEIGALTFVPELRLESAGRLTAALLGYDPVVVVLGVAGLLLALRRRALWPVCAFVLLWAAVFLTNRSDHVRYLLPAAVLLALPAGLLAERLLSRPASRALLALLLALPLVQALRLAHVLSQPDTRALAEARLLQLPEGAVLAIDRYGPEVELSRAALYRLVALRNSLGETLRSREQHRKLLLDAGLAQGGIDAVRVEELFEVDEREGHVRVRVGLESLGTDAPAVFAALGVTHLLVAEREPDRPPRAPLLDPVVLGLPVWSINPAVPGRIPLEARLPTELSFPLLSLWQVERPGPLLTLHELR